MPSRRSRLSAVSGCLCLGVQRSILIAAILHTKRAVYPIILRNSALPLSQGLTHYLGEDGLQIKLPEGLNEQPVEDVRTLGRALRSIEKLSRHSFVRSGPNSYW